MGMTAKKGLTERTVTTRTRENVDQSWKIKVAQDSFQHKDYEGSL